MMRNRSMDYHKATGLDKGGNFGTRNASQGPTNADGSDSDNSEDEERKAAEKEAEEIKELEDQAAAAGI